MGRVPPRAAMLIWVVLIPLLLIGLGGWERARAHRSVAAYAALRRDLPRRVADLRALGARDPYASVDLGERTLYAPALAADRIEALEPSVGRSLFLARAQQPLAWGVMGGALLALVAGTIGLVAARVAAGRAMRSRDALVAGFAALQRALPLILDGMVAGLALAVVGAILFELISLWNAITLDGAGLKLMTVALACGAGMLTVAWLAVRALRGIAALYTPEPGRVTGRAIAEADAPALWRFVRDIAARQGVMTPDTVVLGLRQGFYVTEQDLLLFPGERRVSGRTLYLPAPYLRFLNEGEVAAIVGHELAHFAGEDTAYSRRFAPLYAGLQRALAAMRGEAGLLLNGPLLLAGDTLERFDHAVQHWSRLREFEADRLGAIVSGPRDAAAALVRTAVVAPPVEAVLDHAFEHPPAEDADLVAAAAELVAARGWPDIATTIADAQSHPTDTHPPTSDRIRRLEVPLDDALLAIALRPAGEAAAAAGARLIADWAAWCARLSADYLAETRDAHARHRRFLEETAAAVPAEPVTLHNAVGPAAWVQFGAAMLFAAAAVAIWVGRRPLGFAHDLFALRLLIGVCGVAILFCLVGGLLIRRSGRTPFLILTPDGLTAPKLSDPIAWRDVAGWSVVHGRRFGLDLLLAEGAPLPRARRFARGTKVQGAKRLVTIAAYGVRGMRVDAFREMIDRYLRADQARRMLAEAAAAGRPAAADA